MCHDNSQTYTKRALYISNRDMPSPNYTIAHEAKKEYPANTRTDAKARPC